MSLSLLDDSQWLSAASIRLENSVSVPATNPIILDPLAGENYELLIGDLLQAKSVDNMDIFRLFDRWVIQVDIVGLVRSVNEREKLSLIEVDDGTGCVCCTIWRTEPITIDRHDDGDIEMESICEHLLQLSNYRDNVGGRRRGRLPGLGQLVHIRGRLKRFRGKLKINAYYYRILTNTAEVLPLTLQREALRREIYGHAYDPKETAQKLLSSRSRNTARNIVEKACDILSEDGLRTFTKLDLCLNNRLADALIMDELIAFDESEALHFTESSTEPKTSEAKDLQALVDNLIHCLLKTGWIYPAEEPIGGNKAFHTVRDDREIKDAVCQVISILQQQSNLDGVSSSTILKFMRADGRRDLARLTLIALNRVLDALERESCIYQTGVLRYKLA